jgi:hypothetical protein
MTKTKRIKLSEEIIDILKRERVSPSEAIGLIEVVKTNILLNLFVGMTTPDKPKGEK